MKGRTEREEVQRTKKIDKIGISLACDPGSLRK